MNENQAREVFEALASKPEFAALTHWGIFKAGWKLVPVEPTIEMLKAADKADEAAYVGGADHGATAETIWAHMIDATPAPAPETTPAPARCLPPLPEPHWPRGYQGCVPSGGYTADQMHAYARAALAAKPAAPLPELCEQVCAAIKAADDKSVEEAGYMLDSNDCIAIVRKEFARAALAATPAPAPDNSEELKPLNGMSKEDALEWVRNLQSAAPAPEARCQCGLKPASECEPWEQGCDLGQNPDHVLVHRVTPTQAQQAEPHPDTADAERYRWLRQYNTAKHPQVTEAFFLGDRNLDAAIDAARGIGASTKESGNA